MNIMRCRNIHLGLLLAVLIVQPLSICFAGEKGMAVAPVNATAPGGNAALFVGVNQFTED